MPSRLTFTPSMPHDGRVAVAGEMDAHTVSTLVAWLETVRAHGHRELVLDVSAVEFIDSAGLQALVRQGRELRAQGGSLALQHPGDAIWRLLTVTDLVDKFDVDESPPPQGASRHDRLRT